MNIKEVYFFQELPNVVQYDFVKQFDDNTEYCPTDFLFSLKIISYETLMNELDDIFGPNLIDEIEDEYIIELAKDIQINGLKYPPIGTEGMHRKLAHLYLKRNITCYDIHLINLSNIETDLS